VRAAIVERPGELVVRELPDPVPGEYEALCEILYGATCTGTDQHIIAGRFPFPCFRYPTILGHESIGRVVTVGRKVRSFRPGDLVTRVGAPPVGGVDSSWGGFAELGLALDYRAMKWDGRPRSEWDRGRVNQVLPPGIDPAGATMIITWRETLSYVTRMGLRAGSRVLVIGSGGTGLSFAAHARNAAAEIVAMAGSGARRAAAESLGVRAFADYRSADAPELLGRACEGGFDIMVDAVGRAGTLDRFLRLAAPGAVVGIYGVDEYGSCSIRPQTARASFTFYNGGYDEEEAHDRVVAMLADGRLDPRQFLDMAHPYPLAEVARAFEAVRERRAVKALVKLA